MTTAMKVAFERAGFELDEEKLERLARESRTFNSFLIELDRDREVALALFEPDEIEARARRYWSTVRRDHEVRVGGGRTSGTNGQPDRTPAGADELAVAA